MIHCVISFYNIPNWIKCVKTVAPKIPMGPRSGSITCTGISTRKYILKKFFTSIIYEITIQIRVHSNVLLFKCFNFNDDPLTNNWVREGVANSALEYIDKHLEKKFVKIHNSTIYYCFFLMLQQNLDIKYQVSRQIQINLRRLDSQRSGLLEIFRYEVLIYNLKSSKEKFIFLTI